MTHNYFRILYLIIYLITGFSVVTTLFYYLYTPRASALDEHDLPTPILQANISKILERNIFNTEGHFPEIGQLKQAVLQCVGTPKKSSLPYKVMGILYGGSSRTSMAMLQNKNTENILILKYRDKLPEDGYISGIDQRKVWITDIGCPEYLDIPRVELPPSRIRKGGGSGSASERSYSEDGFERIGTNTRVTREWVDDILNNKLNSVLSDSYVAPNMVNGRINGFIISQIEPMSVFDKIGLKDGDIITSINGISLNDPGRAIQTLNGLRNESKVTMQVIRNGKPTTFTVNVR